MAVALAMDDDDDTKDTELDDTTDLYCDACDNNGWVYDEENGGTMCCPDCESE